jgi:hypothetical protein
MFLERNAAWLVRPRAQEPRLVGVQSPYEAATSAAFLLGEAAAPFKPQAIDAQFAYVGGGQGRDHTLRSCCLGGDVFPRPPGWLAHNRYQQFGAASSGML